MDQMTIWLRRGVARDTGKGGWKISWLGYQVSMRKTTAFTSDNSQCAAVLIANKGSRSDRQRGERQRGKPIVEEPGYVTELTGLRRLAVVSVPWARGSG